MAYLGMVLHLRLQSTNCVKNILEVKPCPRCWGLKMNTLEPQGLYSLMNLPEPMLYYLCEDSREVMWIIKNNPAPHPKIMDDCHTGQCHTGSHPLLHYSGPLWARKTVKGSTSDHRVENTQDKVNYLLLEIQGQGIFNLPKKVHTLSVWNCDKTLRIILLCLFLIIHLLRFPIGLFLHFSPPGIKNGFS